MFSPVTDETKIEKKNLAADLCSVHSVNDFENEQDQNEEKKTSKKKKLSKSNLEMLRINKYGTPNSHKWANHSLTVDKLGLTVINYGRKTTLNGDNL